MDSRPPFEDTYNTFFGDCHSGNNNRNLTISAIDVGECVLPLIDLSRLNSTKSERDACVNEIVQAAGDWGFFQIVNHGIPQNVLQMMHHEEKQLFRLPFAEKSRDRFLNVPNKIHTWGNLQAAKPEQFSCSEAFHISVADVSKMDESASLRLAMEAYVQQMDKLALDLCDLLGKSLNLKDNYFQESCKPQSSYVRMNKYYPNQFLSEVLYGLVPHTDSDFLTILFQDQIGGLQLKKDGKWFRVNPSPKALVINIGDLFQALSNGVYRSLEHRVAPPRDVERLSIGYFFCPSLDTKIESFSKPQVYRSFSFKEFKEQVKQDVEETGMKVGLSRFLRG